MRKNCSSFVAWLCALTIAMVFAAPASAQTNEVKEKPRMYTYIANWNIPRAQWGDMEKSNAADQKMLEKAMSSGTIIGYGEDMNLVHRPDGSTHDDWWSAMSMGGILDVLDQAYKSGNATAPVLANASKHWDTIFVSRYYNWHPGSYKDVYTHGSCYKLKDTAPDDAIDTLSKNLIVPMMEKMLAEGNIHEYEVDTEAIHTESVGSFCIFDILANAQALDKVNAAIRDTFKTNPTYGPTFDSMVDFTGHRDELARTNATYK